MPGAPKLIRSCPAITSNINERRPANEDRGSGQKPAQPRGDEGRGRHRHGGERRLRRHVADVGEVQGTGWPEGDRSRNVPDVWLPDGDRGGERRDRDARGENSGRSAIDVGRGTGGAAWAVAAGENSLCAIGR